MSKAPGVPLSTYGWSCGSSTPEKPLTFQQKQQIMSQLGKISASLSNLRSNQLGSLVLSDKGYEVRKCLYPGFVWFGRDKFDDNYIQRGPFNDVQMFYRALLSAFFAHIKELPLLNHLFHAPVPNEQAYEDFHDYKVATHRWNGYAMLGSKIEGSKNRLDYILAGIALLVLVPLLAEKDNQFMCSGFPLCHPDLSLGNIFIDEQLSISCIIDWGFASFIPQSMFFICPGLPQSRYGTNPNLEPPFAQGFIEGHGFDAQRDLDFSNSSIFWKFKHLVNFDFLEDYSHLSDLVSSLTGQAVHPLLETLKHREKFTQELRALAEETPCEEELREMKDDEERFFTSAGPEDLTIARHLTVIAELNPRFVVSDQLWNWISFYLDERELYMFPASEALAATQSKSVWRLCRHRNASWA